MAPHALPTDRTLVASDAHRSSGGAQVKCGLTLRSWGLPPARHLARAPASAIIRCAGQVPCRRQPLSSNVRPHQMLPTVGQCLRSAIKGGAVAIATAPLAVIAPALLGWPQASDIGGILEAAGIMLAIGAVFGPLVGLVAGFPILYALSRVRLATPLLVGIAGACLGVLFVAGFFNWPPPSASLFALGIAIGAPCAVVAALQLRRELNAEARAEHSQTRSAA